MIFDGRILVYINSSTCEDQPTSFIFLIPGTQIFTSQHRFYHLSRCRISLKQLIMSDLVNVESLI